MIAAFHIIDGQTPYIFVMRTSGKIAKASLSEIGGLGDEAPDENVAVPLPAQKIREATCRCVEALSQKRLMESWIRAINVTRNICPHHARLWNRPIVIQPKWPTAAAVPLLAHLTGNTHAQTRVYGIAAICAYLLRSINPSSGWRTRFADHIATFPHSTIINLAAAGFINGWNTQPLWN